MQSEVIVHRLSKSGMGSFDALVAVCGCEHLHVFLLRGVQKAAPNLRQNGVVQAVLHLVDEEDLFAGSDQLRIDREQANEALTEMDRRDFLFQAEINVDQSRPMRFDGADVFEAWLDLTQQ